MKMKFDLRRQKWIIFFCRLLLGTIFIYAAILKMVSPQDYADSIAEYQILPFSAINLFALGLPFFELACGLAVITGIFIRIGVLGIFAMLVIFIAALAVALLRGLSVHCGCFGADSWLDSNPWVALFRDAFLLLLSTLIYKYNLVKIKTAMTLLS